MYVKRIGRSNVTQYTISMLWPVGRHIVLCEVKKQESLALASMARDDPSASSTASSTARPSSTAAVLLAAMRGKVGSEFET